MAKATQTPALDELVKHDGAIEKARARIDELQAERRAVEQNADRALSALEGYYRDLGAGRTEQDPQREEELQQAVYETDGELTSRTVVNHPEAEDPYRVETVHPRLDGLLAGAREALTTAEHERTTFIRRRFEDLVTELAADGGALTQRFEEAWAAVQQCDDEWRQQRRRWRPLVEAGAFAWGDFPEPPLGGRRPLRAPVPRQLTEAGGQMPRPSLPRLKVRKRAA